MVVVTVENKTKQSFMFISGRNLALYLLVTSKGAVAAFFYLFIPLGSAGGICRVAVAVPPSVRQVVLFSSGPWGDRICVNAELNDATRMPITIGKLTPYNKYVQLAYV